MAVRAACAAPFAAPAALRAALPAFFTSFCAAWASSAASSAAAFALAAAVCAFSDSATACSIVRWARLPSRSTMATSWSMVAFSWSRARAMCCSVSRNQPMAPAVPSSRARCADVFT
ncbi:hypothetical protein ACFQZ0_21300 [Streptomyces erythrogriseus]